MVVVAHQAKGHYPRIEPMNGLAQKLEEFLPLQIVRENLAVVNPAGHHVINRAGKLNAPGSGHERILARMGVI